MKKIFKYQFKINDTVTITMPAGAEILSIQYQGDVPTVWAIVNPNNEYVKRDFYVFGTGHSIPETTDSLKYLATIQDSTGFVWHVFE